MPPAVHNLPWSNVRRHYWANPQHIVKGYINLWQGNISQTFSARTVPTSAHSACTPSRKKVRSRGRAKRQALQDHCQGNSDSVNQVSRKIADIGFDTEDATVGVTKLLDSIESTKQLLARLLTGAGACHPKAARAGRALTAWLLRSSSEGLRRPEASSRNGPSSKCARRTRPCQTRASRSAECRFL